MHYLFWKQMLYAGNMLFMKFYIGLYILLYFVYEPTFLTHDMLDWTRSRGCWAASLLFPFCFLFEHQEIVWFKLWDVWCRVKDIITFLIFEFRLAVGVIMLYFDLLHWRQWIYGWQENFISFVNYLFTIARCFLLMAYTCDIWDFREAWHIL